MLQERKRCWLTHKYHEGWDFCPLCKAPLRWEYYDGEWVPCDREPIHFKRDIEGKVIVFTNHSLKDYCAIYHPGDKEDFKLGLLPHVFSCDKLRGYRGTKIER